MSHDHDHPHQHGPGCGCGHQHDHDHPAVPASSPPPPAPAPEVPLDPGSQALAEALRSSFAIVKFVMVVLVGVFLVSGFFTVGPQERAVVLRLGRPLGEGQKVLLGPGLHFALPYPIDEVVKVPITEVQRVTSTVGWYFVTPEQEVAGNEPQEGPSSLNPEMDGYVVTADKNIVHARATLNYRIEDPIQYLFGFTGGTNHPFNGLGASNLVVNALNNALVQTAAEYLVDDILTRDVSGFKDAVRRRAASLLDDHKLGVVVEQLDVTPKAPLSLKADFARVTDAVQTRDKLINEARTYENRTLSQAGASVVALTNTAESDRTWYVESLRAEASRFNDLLPKYRENPELFTQLRLTETLARVMINAQDKIYVSENPSGRARELWLQLNREPRKVRTQPAPPGTAP